MSIEKFFSAAREKLKSPSERVREKIPYLEELNLTPDEVKWVDEVRQQSDEYLEEERKRREKKPDVSIEPHLTAFNLVEVHLLMRKDLKRLGPHLISKRTEKKLDLILEFMVSQFEKWIEKYHLKFPTTSSQGYSVQMRSCIEKYAGAFTAEEKAVVLTRFLNIWHSGGSSISLKNFGGIPQPKGEFHPYQEKDFLEKLNELGGKF